MGSSKSLPKLPFSAVRSTSPLKFKMLFPETSANPPSPSPDPVAEAKPVKVVTPSAHIIIRPPSPSEVASAVTEPETFTLREFEILGLSP